MYAGTMNLLGLATCLFLASTASGQLPVSAPASVAQPYVQGAANVITNATQAGANTVGAVANTINTLTTGPGQVGTSFVTTWLACLICCGGLKKAGPCPSAVLACCGLVCNLGFDCAKGLGWVYVVFLNGHLVSGVLQAHAL